MELFEVIRDVVIGLAAFGYAIKYVVDYVKKKGYLQKQQQDYAEVSVSDTIRRTKIYKSLWEDLAKYTPNGRIIIMQYHNGGKFYTGKDIQRMTLTCEVKHPDLPSIKGEYQGIVIGEEFAIHRQLIDGEVYANKNVDDEGIKSIMNHHDMSSFYAVMHKNAYGLPLASVIYCFTNEIDSLDESERAAIKRKCNTIFNLLEDIKDKRASIHRE